MTALPTSFEDLARCSGGFLLNAMLIESQIKGAVLAWAEVEQGLYKPELFDRLGIDCPSHISSAVKSRQADYLAGRAMAAVGLRIAGVQTTTIASGQHNAPHWPGGSTGSISHSANRCACLISANPAHLLGVDIEGFATGDALTAICETCLSADEIATIEAQSAFRKPELVTLVFSAKETLFKSLYPVVRDFFGFSAAKLVAVPTGNRLQLELTTDLHPDFQRKSVVDLHFRLDTNHVLTWAGVEKPKGGAG